MGKKRGPNHVQREETRRRLIEAAIVLVAEFGPAGFPMADVAPRAGLGRAITGYYFTGRAGLLGAAIEVMARGIAVPTKPVSSTLIDHFHAQCRLAAKGDPETLAMLRICSDAAARGELAALRDDLRLRLSRGIEHLLRGSSKRRSAAPAAEQLAPILLGTLQGEMLRLATGAAPAEDLFIAMVRAALKVDASPSEPEPSTPSRQSAAQLPLL